MRYRLYLASMVAGLTFSGSAWAQTVEADPFDIAAAALVTAGLSESQAQPGSNSPDLLNVNLGPAGSEKSQALYDGLTAAFTTNYGPPPPQRSGIKTWDIPTESGPNKSGSVQMADMTHVMLYVSNSGNAMLKLDRRKPVPTAPRVSRPVSKPKSAPAIAQKQSRTQSPASGSALIWNGQPD